MRKLLPVLALASLGGCISPLPAVNPQMAWVDLDTHTGKLIMAESLDKQRLRDGRFFQVTPGSHELVARFDFEVYAGGMAMNLDPSERLCYLSVHYDHFEAGRRYRLEGISLGFNASARLYNDRGEVVAEENKVFCIP
ncbi:hypothetical protein [Pseudomonas sp. FEN]|uniref:PA0061/PA0062 family lipoprotein n=1 Tax=Pseudomonas sp. FEN TaxID=2767468 RepID=UPI00174CC9BF|nr:hypothetical protein [Pseudomonas sp. FEN]